MLALRAEAPVVGSVEENLHETLAPREITGYYDFTVGMTAP